MKVLRTLLDAKDKAPGSRCSDRRRPVRHGPSISAKTSCACCASTGAQAELKLRNRTTYHDHGLVFSRTWQDAARPHDVLDHALQINNLGQRSFLRLIKAAQVRRIRFHDLRHTAATLMLQAGVSANVVQERLGHKKIEITLNIYAHVLPAMQQDAAERMAALLGSSC